LLQAVLDEMDSEARAPEGKEIEAGTRGESAEKPSVEGPVEHMIVSVDGAFVKATRSKN